MIDLNLDEIEQMIKDGIIRIHCPKCSMLLDSIYVKKCSSCKKKITSNDVIIYKIDWFKSN